MNAPVEERCAPPFRSRVERVKLVQFAAGLHLSNPVHFDLAAARAAGYRDVVAPPGYVISNTLQPKDAKLAALGIDKHRALAGEMSFEHGGVICAGDELHGLTRLTGRRSIGGERPKTLFTVQTEVRNQADNLVLKLVEIVVQSELAP
jgi:acyl dehydratase